MAVKMFICILLPLFCRGAHGLWRYCLLSANIILIHGPYLLWQSWNKIFLLDWNNLLTIQSKEKYLVLLTKSWLSFDRYKNITDSKQRKNLWPYIAMRALKPHAYTYTSKHIYMIQVNEGNKLWGSAFCPFRKLIITLYQVEIIFCLHPDHKIPQYDHLLKALALKESHAAFTMWGMYLQTIQHKKHICVPCPCFEEIFQLSSKTK